MALSTTAKGNGTVHQANRRRLKPIVNGGSQKCCLCGERILPGQDWDLDHTPDRRGYRGVAHAHCNRSEGAMRANSPRRQSRAW